MPLRIMEVNRLLPGKSCIGFHSHRECMEEDYEYANDWQNNAGKIREKYQNSL